ncbi:CoA transferase, partial [Mycobacterium avium]
LLDDAHVRATQHLVDVPYVGLPRPAAIADFPVALSDTPGRIQGPAPTLGADTDAILYELGFAHDRIAEWRSNGVI